MTAGSHTGYRYIAIIACAVKPHVRLGLWLLTGFFEDLDRSLIRMQDVSLEEKFLHAIDHRSYIIVRAFDGPVGHRGS